MSEGFSRMSLQFAGQSQAQWDFLLWSMERLVTQTLRIHPQWYWWGLHAWKYRHSDILVQCGWYLQLFPCLNTIIHVKMMCRCFPHPLHPSPDAGCGHRLHFLDPSVSQVALEHVYLPCLLLTHKSVKCNISAYSMFMMFFCTVSFKNSCGHRFLTLIKCCKAFWQKSTDRHG